MGAIVGSVFVMVVAIVGLIYFTIQDKKENRKAKHAERN